jgi:hypothetical protein
MPRPCRCPHECTARATARQRPQPPTTPQPGHPFTPLPRHPCHRRLIGTPPTMTVRLSYVTIRRSHRRLRLRGLRCPLDRHRRPDLLVLRSASRGGRSALVRPGGSPGTGRLSDLWGSCPLRSAPTSYSTALPASWEAETPAVSAIDCTLTTMSAARISPAIQRACLIRRDLRAGSRLSTRLSSATDLRQSQVTIR